MIKKIDVKKFLYLTYVNLLLERAKLLLPVMKYYDKMILQMVNMLFAVTQQLKVLNGQDISFFVLSGFVRRDYTWHVIPKQLEKLVFGQREPAVVRS